MTYRYPVPEGVQLKGYVFFNHGYGGYCEHYAFFFKAFAEAGYDSICLDQRGFGNSEGIRGWIENEETLYGDIYLCIFKAVEKYKIDLQKIPIFLVGKSLGGLISYNMSAHMPSMFRGLGLIVPFFRHYENRLYKNEWLFKIINSVNPKKTVKAKNVDKTTEYYKSFKFYYEDPKNIEFSMIRTLLIFIQE